MTTLAPAAPRPITALPPGGPAPQVDNSLVPGLRLPKIPGLPGPDSPGTPLDKLLGPPARGSAAERADMAVVKGAQLLRTPAGDSWALRMAKDGPVKIWVELARRQQSLTGQAPTWLKLATLATTLATNGAASAVAKFHFKRDRPFIVDPRIQPPVPKPSSSSYPSGHASSAFAAARVIARMAPSLAAEAYSLATQVAVSRVYAGVHFPSDVVAGAALGTAVGDAVLRALRQRELDGLL